MLGIGKWQAEVKNMFFSGKAILEIKDDGGKYGMNLELPDSDLEIPEINIISAEEDGSTLLAKAEVSLLPGKEIDVNITFDGDVCNGFLKVPFVGKIKISNAAKIG